MNDGIYEELRSLLSKNVYDLPYAPELMEILSILYTEKEAEVALGLNYRGLSAAKVAENVGMELDSVKKLLETMADKGVIFSKKSEKGRKYSHLPSFLLFETPYKSGRQSEMADKLRPLIKKYKPAFRSALYSESAPLLRVIPIQETIERDSRVLPYDKLYELIDKAEVTGVTHCACRELEQNCDNPRETCMVFGDTCSYFVERGMGRFLTKEEMKSLLNKCEEAGLIHMINAYQEKPIVICNCCPCCCGPLEAYKSGHLGILSKSAFLPKNIIEECEGCGICADERCQMQAIKITDERPEINLENCIGCGLCTTGCPNNAMRMERVAGVAEPFPTSKEYGQVLLEENGKMESFLEVLMKA